MTSKTKKDRFYFPTGRLFLSAVLGTIFRVFLMWLEVLKTVSIVPLDVKVKMMGVSFASFWITLLAVGLPMAIANARKLKAREWVYAWSFFGGILPFGLLILIPTFIFSCLSKNKEITAKK